MVEQLRLGDEHPDSDGDPHDPRVGVEVAAICVPPHLYGLVDL